MLHSVIALYLFAEFLFLCALYHTATMSVFLLMIAVLVAVGTTIAQRHLRRTEMGDLTDAKTGGKDITSASATIDKLRSHKRRHWSWDSRDTMIRSWNGKTKRRKLI